jgi:branched-subunit amino acid transport protein
MTIWLIMLVAGLMTYAIRLSFILLWGHVNVPVWLQRSLRFVPPAVLTAIFFPELFLPSGSLNISIRNDRLLAGVLAALVAWRTRNIVLTILVGMVALLLLQLL